MTTPQYVAMMADYNQWQNENLYGVADGLGEDERRRNRGAFFGSIHATLSHLLWGDRIWMSRFAGTPKPEQANIPASIDEGGAWAEMRAARTDLDRRIVAWARDLDAGTLAGDLSWYSGALQADVVKPLTVLVCHFFNHQTHHRGQLHAMLTQAGAKPGDTDLFIMPSLAT